MNATAGISASIKASLCGFQRGSSTDITGREVVLVLPCTPYAVDKTAPAPHTATQAKAAHAPE